jgi:hypothetical protein
MHEVDSFFNFAKNIFLGFKEAAKTDINVFLLIFAAFVWPFKILRGLFASTVIYVIIRRVDDLMSVHVNLKKQELNQIKNVIQ